MEGPAIVAPLIECAENTLATRVANTNADKEWIFHKTIRWTNYTDFSLPGPGSTGNQADPESIQIVRLSYHQ